MNAVPGNSTLAVDSTRTHLVNGATWMISYVVSPLKLIIHISPLNFFFSVAQSFIVARQLFAAISQLACSVASNLNSFNLLYCRYVAEKYDNISLMPKTSVQVLEILSI